MNSSPPSPETVRFIAKVLARRQTEIEEIPALIDAICQGVEAIEQPAEPATAAEMVEVAAPQPIRRGRGRPRKEPPAMVTAPPAPPPAPRLMRRADVQKPAEAPALRPLIAPKAAVRGIVKWYDARTRRGALRLPGYGSDIAVDADALDRAGIPRLYKGQEIEASVATAESGVPRLITLSLPGRPETETLLPHGPAKGSPRRNAKPVVIELKRDALRRVGARLEAEHILGGGGPRRR
jgi:cold shock CspA family protein